MAAKHVPEWVANHPDLSSVEKSFYDVFCDVDPVRFRYSPWLFKGVYGVREDELNEIIASLVEAGAIQFDGEDLVLCKEPPPPRGEEIRFVRHERSHLNWRNDRRLSLEAVGLLFDMMVGGGLCEPIAQSIAEHRDVTARQAEAIIAELVTLGYAYRDPDGSLLFGDSPGWWTR